MEAEQKPARRLRRPRRNPEAVVDAKDETESMRWCARPPFLDYAFFQEFTRKIEGATAEEAKRLKAAASRFSLYPSGKTKT